MKAIEMNNVKVSIGPCNHENWTIPVTTGSISCLSCGVSKNSTPVNYDDLVELLMQARPYVAAYGVETFLAKIDSALRASGREVGE